MKLKEVIDKLQEVYNNHGDIDVEIVQNHNEIDSNGKINRTVEDIVYTDPSVRLYNY